MGLMDFFSREAGQNRRAWLNEREEELLGGLRRGVGPQGSPQAEAVIGLLDLLNPINSMGEAGEAFSRFRDTRGWDRVEALGDTMTGMAEVLAPVGAVGRGVGAGRRALQESLVGYSPSEAAATLATARHYDVPSRLEYVRDGGYQAQAGKPSAVAIPDRGRFEARPIGPIEEAAADYMRSRGVDDFGPVGSYPDFDEETAAKIAAAYQEMRHNPTDPLVRRAYDAMIDETMGQYRALKDSGIDFQFLQPGEVDPYARSPSLGYQDIVENGRLKVFPTDFGFGANNAFDPAENPLLTRVGRVGDKPDAVANDAFRVVHDVFGHFGPGNPFFRHQGEERAWQEHSRMYSPDARGAMTSETRGQNSWLNFGPHGEKNRTALGADTVFADQKTGLLPEWMWYAGGVR